MRASLLARKSPAGREIKVVVACPSKVSEGSVIKFAKKATKHLRVSRGWSAPRNGYSLSKFADSISRAAKSDTSLPADATGANLLANKILDVSTEKPTEVGATPGNGG